MRPFSFWNGSDSIRGDGAMPAVQISVRAESAEGLRGSSEAVQDLQRDAGRMRGGDEAVAIVARAMLMPPDADPAPRVSIRRRSQERGNLLKRRRGASSPGSVTR